MSVVQVEVHRTDGTVELRDVLRPRLLDAVRELIGAKSVEPLNLSDGTVMLVNEDGWDVELVEHPPRDGYDFVIERRPTRRLLPVNQYATDRWFKVVGPQPHPIVGDVAIVSLSELR